MGWTPSASCLSSRRIDNERGGLLTSAVTLRVSPISTNGCAAPSCRSPASNSSASPGQATRRNPTATSPSNPAREWQARFDDQGYRGNQSGYDLHRRPFERLCDCQCRGRRRQFRHITSCSWRSTGIRPSDSQVDRGDTQVWGAKGGNGEKSLRFPGSAKGRRIYPAKNARDKWALHFSSSSTNVKADLVNTEIAKGYDDCQANLSFLGGAMELR